MSYQLEIRHLRYFKVVAEELHYRKASEKLFISQPGLSRQIKQMEETMQIQLFERNKRNVALTEAGKYLKGEVDFIFNHLELIKKQVKQINDGKNGEIRIGFLGSAMQNVIPDLLLKMRTHLPEVNTTLEEMANAQQVEAIEKDRLDIGFVRIARVPPGISMIPLLKDSFSVVLPESHSLNENNFKSVKQLKDENFILFSSDYSPTYFDKIMSICEDKGFTPKVSHKSVHAQTIFKLVELGLGVAIVPTSLKSGFDLKVKLLEIKNIPQTTILSLIWKEQNRNAILENVLKLLK